MPIDTVLLVDDNPSDNFLHRLVVQEAKVANEVIEFSRATEALEFLRTREREDSCLIFLDINMPHMSGFEFLEEYNRLDSSRKRHVVVLMLTTSLHYEDQKKAASCPDLRESLNKPLSVGEVARIAADYF